MIDVLEEGLHGQMYGFSAVKMINEDDMRKSLEVFQSFHILGQHLGPAGHPRA